MPPELPREHSTHGTTNDDGSDISPTDSVTMSDNIRAGYRLLTAHNDVINSSDSDSDWSDDDSDSEHTDGNGHDLPHAFSSSCCMTVPWDDCNETVDADKSNANPQDSVAVDAAHIVNNSERSGERPNSDCGQCCNPAGADLPSGVKSGNHRAISPSRADTVRSIMSGVVLSDSAVPEWARNLTDCQLKSAIETVLNKR